MRGLALVLLLAGVSLSTALGPIEAGAQSQEEYFVTLRAAVLRTWDLELRPKFREIGDERTRQVLSSIRFRVVRFSDFNAFADYERREIILPAGLLLNLDFIIDGHLLVWKRPSYASKLRGYMEYLTEQYVAALKGKKVSVKSFDVFAGISRKTAETIRDSAGFGDLKATAWISTLSLVVGHELGHHVLRHKPSRLLAPQESQAQEYAADNFGYLLADRGGFDPLFGVVSTYLVFAMLDGGTTLAEDSGTHPPALCRISRLYTLGLERYLNDPKAIEGLGRVGGNVDDLRRDAKKLKDECASVS